MSRKLNIYTIADFCFLLTALHQEYKYYILIKCVNFFPFSRHIHSWIGERSDRFWKISWFFKNTTRFVIYSCCQAACLCLNPFWSRGIKYSYLDISLVNVKFVRILSKVARDEVQPHTLFCVQQSLPLKYLPAKNHSP